MHWVHALPCYASEAGHCQDSGDQQAVGPSPGQWTMGPGRLLGHCHDSGGSQAGCWAIARTVNSGAREDVGPLPGQWIMGAGRLLVHCQDSEQWPPLFNALRPWNTMIKPSARRQLLVYNWVAVNHATVFVCWSSLNIARLCFLFKPCIDKGYVSCDTITKKEKKKCS